MIRRRVDFPAPLGPTKPVTAPLGAEKVTLSRACSEPYLFEMSQTSITMCPPC